MVITDGHHRYESAVAYRDEMVQRQVDRGFMHSTSHMSYIVPFQEEGLIVLPTHRLLKDHKLDA